jgi:hypothetical protein
LPTFTQNLTVASHIADPGWFPDGRPECAGCDDLLGSGALIISSLL